MHVGLRVKKETEIPTCFVFRNIALNAVRVIYLYDVVSDPMTEAGRSDSQGQTKTSLRRSAQNDEPT